MLSAKAKTKQDGNLQRYILGAIAKELTNDREANLPEYSFVAIFRTINLLRYIQTLKR